MGAPGEGFAHQTGEDRLGTDFQKSAATVLVEAIHQADEIHRPHHLVGKGKAGTFGVGRVGGRLGVAVDRDAARGDGRLPNRLGERPTGVGDQGAVKGGGHGEAHGAQFLRPQLFFQGGDGRRGAGKHPLARAVAVGEDHALGQRQGFQLFQGRLDRQHGTWIGTASAGVGHDLAAEGREAGEGLEVDATGGPERREFAEAVAGQGIRHQAEARQYPVPCGAQGADGRLGPVGGLEGGGVSLGRVRRKIGGRIDQVGQAWGLIDSFLNDFHRLAGLGKKAHHVAAHLGILAALAGKQHGEFARCRAGAHEDAPGKRGRVRIGRL